MKRKLHLILLILGVLILSTPSTAMTILPPSGSTFAPGSQTTFTITADPPAGEWDFVQVDLTLTGGQVTALTLDAAVLSPAGDCDSDGAMFLTDNVCFHGSFGPPDGLTQGQAIATFTVTWGSVGTATLVKGSNNIYANFTTEDSEPDPGNYTFIISATAPTATPTPTPTPTPSPTPTALPPTGILDDNRYFIAGLGLIIAGFLIYSYASKNYLFKSKDN